jgi:hypothetical protein
MKWCDRWQLAQESSKRPASRIATARRSFLLLPLPISKRGSPWHERRTVCRGQSRGLGKDDSAWAGAGGGAPKNPPRGLGETVAETPSREPRNCEPRTSFGAMRVTNW